MTRHARSPFLALVRQEVGRSATVYGNPIAWFLAVALLAINIGPALVLWLRPEVPLFLLLQESWASMMMCWWLWFLIMECSNSLVRGVWSFLAPLGIPPHHSWNEFLATRAVDRALHFRAKTAMLVVFVVLPMLLNFGLICLVARQFPPDIRNFVDTPPATQFEAASVATATAFAWAMVWASAAGIVLAQGYYGLVARLLTERGTVRAVCLACLPILLGLAGFYVVRFSFESDQDRMAPTVRFFARHWLELTLALLALAVVVQRYCEQRFAEQEVL